MAAKRSVEGSLIEMGKIEEDGFGGGRGGSGR